MYAQLSGDSFQDFLPLMTGSTPVDPDGLREDPDEDVDGKNFDRECNDREHLLDRLDHYFSEPHW